jgi:hypothetical protein
VWRFLPIYGCRLYTFHIYNYNYNSEWGMRKYLPFYLPFQHPTIDIVVELVSKYNSCNTYSVFILKLPKKMHKISIYYLLYGRIILFFQLKIQTCFYLLIVVWNRDFNFMSIISNQNSSILKSVVLGGLEQFNCPTWDSSGRGLVRRIPTLYLGTFNNRQLNYVIFNVKPSPFDFSPMCDKQFFLL